MTGPPPGSSQAKKKPPLKKKLTTKLSYTRLYVVGVSTPFFREGTLVMGVSTSMPSEQKPHWLYIVDVGSSIPFQEVESCSYTPYILGVRQTARDVHKKHWCLGTRVLCVSLKVTYGEAKLSTRDNHCHTIFSSKLAMINLSDKLNTFYSFKKGKNTQLSHTH